jgi:hypothetical protein
MQQFQAADVAQLDRAYSTPQIVEAWNEIYARVRLKVNGSFVWIALFSRRPSNGQSFAAWIACWAKVDKSDY